MTATIWQEMHSAAERYLDKQLQQPACGCRVEYVWRFLHQPWPEVGAVITVKPCEQHASEAACQQLARDFEDRMRSALAVARQCGSPLDLASR